MINKAIKQLMNVGMKWIAYPRNGGLMAGYNYIFLPSD